MDEFKMQLNFASFVKLSMIISGCMGVGSAPILIFLQWGSMGPAIIPFALVLCPLFALFNGILAGLIGYPVYFWLSKRVGFRFKAHIFPIRASQ